MLFLPAQLGGRGEAGGEVGIDGVGEKNERECPPLGSAARPSPPELIRENCMI